MNKFKQEFPIFSRKQDLVYLDSAATAFKPRPVIEAVKKYYEECSANVHRGLYEMAIKADGKYENARGVISLFIGAKCPEEIFFVSGTTAGINVIAKSIENAKLGPGDEIVVTEWEHHSNLLPWQRICSRKGARLRWFECAKNVELDLSDAAIENLVNKRTRVVAISQSSNVLGQVVDIKRLVGKIKSLNSDCWIVVDAAQSVPHIPVDVYNLGCDFLIFSGHKLYGPTGVGVVWGRKEILDELEPEVWGGGAVKRVSMNTVEYKDAPGKFEPGTPDIAGVLGLAAAVKWINESSGMEVIREHDIELSQYATNALAKIDGVVTYGPLVSQERTGIMAFNLEGIHAHDVAQVLADSQICVRAGHHCAMPLHEKLGVSGSVRVSFGIYNDKGDVDRFVDELQNIPRKLRLK